MLRKSRKHVVRKNKTHKYKGMKHKSHKHKSRKHKVTKKGGRKTRHPKKRYTRKMRGGTWNGDCDVDVEDLTDEEAAEYRNKCVPDSPDDAYGNYYPEAPDYLPPLPPSEFEALGSESSSDDEPDVIQSTFEKNIRAETPPPTYASSIKKPESNIEDYKDVMTILFKQNVDKSRGYIKSQENSINLACTSTKYISKEECDNLKEKLKLYLQQLDTIEENVLTYNNYSYNIPNGDDRRLDPKSEIKSVKDWIKAIDMVTSGAGEIIKNFQFHVMDKCTGTFKYTKLEQKKKGFFQRFKKT